MEISKIILAQALKKSDSSSVHTELSNVLKQFEDKTLEDILNAEENNEIQLIIHKIREIILSEREKTDNVAQIIFSAKAYFHSGFLNEDIKAILIALVVNYYLHIDFDKLLFVNDLNKKNVNEISEKIIQILKNLGLSIQIVSENPYFEKETIREFEEGFSENNITATYKFIESIERSGKILHISYLLEELILFLYYLSFSKFVDMLSYLQNPIEFVIFLQNFSKEELSKIARGLTFSNKWIDFELLRQILGKENKQITPSEIEPIKEILYRIRQNDFSFLKQTVNYFRHNRLFNAVLGVFLASITSAETQEIMADFPINNHSSDIKSRDELLNYYAQSASEAQFEAFLKLIFDKWQKYFETILAEEDFYQNGILLTDFANFVIEYHTYITSDSDLIASINNLMDKIEFIDSQWIATYSQQITKFRLYCSELFLLLSVYKNKELNHPQIQAKYEKFITDEFRFSRYISDEIKIHFKQKINFY